MKKVFIGLLAFAAIAMTGCQNEINEGIEANKEGFKVFSGEIEQAEAENRTTLNEYGQVIWSGAEEINVFAEGASYNYTVATGKDTKEVTFDVVENGEGVPADFEGTHYAVYPYAEAHSVNAEGEFTLDMSGLAVQNAPAVDTYAHGAGYAIAQSNSTEFFFQNVLAAMDVEFSLEGNEFAEMITINKITVTSAEGYNLTGTATAKVGEAAVITANGGNQIVYTVEGATIDAATKYNCIIMVPAVEKAAFTGLTLKVEGENAYTGAPYIWEGSVPANAVKFERNKVTYLKKQIKPIEVDQVFVSNFEQLQAAVDAITTTNEVIINLAEGQYVGALDVTGGKNIVLQPAVEGANVVLAALDHQSNGTPSTVVVNNITFDNSIEIEGWFTGTAQNIKPCVGFWGGNLTFNECVFNVSGASGAETGIMSWWTTSPAANLTLNECTFNGDNSSAPAAQIYGNVNVEVNGCKFYTAKEYAIKLVLGEDNEAVLTNNNVENAQIFVRLGSGPYPGNNYKVTFTNNTLASGIALYDVDNYENQTVVEGAETKFYAANTEGISSYLNGAASPANIYLGAKAYTMATNYSLKFNGFNGTINLFGAGMANTTLSFSSTHGGADGGLNAYADGASLYFKDMKVVSPNTGSAYTGGFGRAANVKFDGCHYVGQWRSNSPTQFVGCTIDPQTSYIYTDYYDVTFDSCTFNASEGKAIQVYNDGATTETTITINKTTFTAAKQATTYSGDPVTAIDINSNGEKFTVNITESSATGFGTGKQSGNDFWNIKGGEANVVINIDGEKVWPVEAVATVGGVEYTEIADALEAAASSESKTVKVVAGSYDALSNVPDGVTIEGAEGTVFEGASSIGGENVTIKNITFTNTTSASGSEYRALTGDLNGDVTFENCHFDSKHGARYCYANGDIVFNKCTFGNEDCIRGVHFDAGEGTVTFNECAIYGFTAMGSSLAKVTFNDCEFPYNNNYNVVNMYSVFEYTNCEFNPSMFTDCAGNGVTATYTNCVYTGSKDISTIVRFDKDPATCTITIDGKTLIADGVMLNAAGEYEISNAAGLAWFGNEVNVNNKNFSGKTVKLVEDITLTEAWTPVGQTGATQFTGSFDGQDHTIYGLTINAPASYDSNDAAGFFGWLESYSGSVIKNIKFDGATIAGYHYVGTVAGYVSGGTEISGCEVTNSTIAALSTVMTSDTNEYRGDKVGGIVGYTNSNNKINNNKVSKTQITGYRQIGGIAGYLYASANGNSIEEVTINVCNDQNTENFTVRNEYGVGSLFGVTAGTATNNTGEATINWGEIPAAKAMVGSTYYVTVEAAITAANGAVVTLLADATVSQQCIVDENGHTLTVTGKFGRTSKKGDGYAYVYPTTDWKIVGSTDTFGNWAYGSSNAVMLQEHSTVVVIRNVELAANTEFKFCKDGSWNNGTQVGAYGEGGTGNISYNSWYGVDQRWSEFKANIKNTTTGTYDLFFATDSGSWYVAKSSDHKEVDNL